jgi:diguanylate cyclase (GGDEF)-like protein
VQDKLVADCERASELSLTDPLTGVYNRRALNRMLRVRLAESTRYSIPVSCVMLDIDHFKRVNDTYGHTTGDRVLREVSSLTLSLFREEDALIRYGGEEFLVILFHCPRKGASAFAERLRTSVADHTFDRDHEPLKITLSAGIATYPEDGDIEGVEGMIAVADRRLYEAKRTGRNRVVFEG